MFWEERLRRPFLWLIVLVVLPQLLGSAVNISYNATQIVGNGRSRTIWISAQQQLFNRLVMGYNAIMYPIAVAALCAGVAAGVAHVACVVQRRVDGGRGVKAARQRRSALPNWIAAFTAWGWFPGGIVFPLAIELIAPPLGPRLAGHFFVSFFVSGLIALAYSLCGAVRGIARALSGDVARRAVVSATRREASWRR